MLSKGPHKVGLRSLLDVCGLTGKEIDSYHIGFVLAPRVNAAGRMSTPDIAARLLLASDEAMAEEARGAGGAAQCREPAPAAGGGGDRRRRRGKVVETDLEVGSRTVHRRRRRGLASRCHRHRRLEAGRRVSSSGDRAVDRWRGGSRVVPQHPVVQHAGGARVVCGRDDQVRRPQAGRRVDDRGRPDSRAARARERVRRRLPRPRRSPTAALDRRGARRSASINEQVGVRADRAGAVRRRQSLPGLPRQPRRDRRRTRGASRTAI